MNSLRSLVWSGVRSDKAILTLFEGWQGRDRRGVAAPYPPINCNYFNMIGLRYNLGHPVLGTKQLKDPLQGALLFGDDERYSRCHL